MEILTPEQFAEWAEFYELEPWGFGVKDAHTGLLASVVARAAGADVKPADFMRPEVEVHEDELTEEEAQLRALESVFGPAPRGPRSERG